MLDPGVAYINVTGVFPDVVGVNASGPATQDGFEFIANFVNDNNLGQAQMILNHAGLTPNGVVESDAASQIKEALWKGFGGAPGTVQQWHLAADPGTTGHRCLFLNGQGILRANYTDLDAANYVGDANNAAVAAAGGGYYRADDAAGTIPNIVGVYLILPETRGYAPRGLDVAASVDPLGASRYLGDNQVDAEQGHKHHLTANVTTGSLVQTLTAANQIAWENLVANDNAYALSGGGSAVAATLGLSGVPTSDGVNGTPRTDSETRMVNFSTKFVVWY